MPDQLTEDVAEAFLQIANRHRQVFHNALAKQGINPAQAFCMKILAENDGCTQSDVADAMHLSRPSVTRLLQRMERGGLVERTIDTHDQRITRVHLTESGRSLLGCLRTGYAEYVAQTVELLSERDRRELAKILSRWVRVSGAGS